MFDKARIKLTVWYSLTIMVISLSFSLIVYHILDREVSRVARVQKVKLEKSIPYFFSAPTITEEIDPELLADTRNRIVLALTMVNSGILALAVMSGFMLAGRALQPIKEMVDEQNRFIGDASHELRTPLTSLKSATEVYLRDKNPTVSESRQLAIESLEEIEKMKLLTDALLQLAQFQKPQRVIDHSLLDLSEIINRAMIRVAAAAKIRGVIITTDLKTEDVYGDSTLLSDLLVILLDNAIKYSKKEGVVTISSRKKDKHTEIEVTDEGIGIDKKDLPHIFERFYRADVARSKEDVGGYGLGLSIADKIVSDLDGRIEVKSKKNKGTTFTVVLPTGPMMPNIFRS